MPWLYGEELAVIGSPVTLTKEVTMGDGMLVGRFDQGRIVSARLSRIWWCNYARECLVGGGGGI